MCRACRFPSSVLLPPTQHEVKAMRNVRKLKAEKLILAERYIYAIAVRCCALASRLSRATRAHTTAHSHARASAHPLPQHNNTHHDAAQAVPNITPKITALAFCDSFPLKLKGLTEKIAMLSDASDQILDSSDLMLVMETVLAIGNAMNDGTRTGSAAGFSLESLLKLTETRSKVKGALIWLWPATRRSALRLACCVLSLRRCLLPLTHRSSRRTPSLLHPHPHSVVVIVSLALAFSRSRVLAFSLSLSLSRFFLSTHHPGHRQALRCSIT